MLTEVENIDLHPVAELIPILEQVAVLDVAVLPADSASSAARGAIDAIARACRSRELFQGLNHGIEVQISRYRM